MVAVSIRMAILRDKRGHVEVVYPCRWCPCVFSTAADLTLHYGAFGFDDHLKRWRSLHREFDRSNRVSDWYEKGLRIYFMVPLEKGGYGGC
jgi:hypothetical protein